MYLLTYLVALKVEPKALYMLGMCSTTELYL